MFKGGKVPDFNSDNKEDMYSITGTIIAQVVNERDKYTMKVIEDYVRERQAKGELIDLNIIEEGKLRHIINLGISMYNHERNIPTHQKCLFNQENHINYLNYLINEQQKENQRLRNQIAMMENPPEIIDLKGGEEE